jgi:hypothetical protein
VSDFISRLIAATDAPLYVLTISRENNAGPIPRTRPMPWPEVVAAYQEYIGCRFNSCIPRVYALEALPDSIADQLPKMMALAAAA